jgi:putative peptidoglycan lipid II flippase
VKIGIVAVVLNLALNLVLTGPLLHVGVALATALSAWFNAVALGLVLARRGQFVPDRRLRRRAPRLLLAAAVMAASVWGIELGLALAPGALPRSVALLAIVAGGAGVFFAAAQALGVVDLRELKGMLRRRRGAAAAAPG